MKRKFSFVITAIAVCLLLEIIEVRAQSTDVPKFEVGADFSTITFNPGQTELGLGGRLTYNLNKHVALEGAGFFFPRRCQFCGRGNDGRITEGLFGVKVGKRFERWGIFGKVRPGVISFSQGKLDFVPTTGIPPTGLGAFPFDFQFRRLTTPVVDVGGVVEVYPTKRTIIRFDAGDTIVRLRERNVSGVLNPPPGVLAPSILIVIRSPAETTHNFQGSIGIAFRF